MDFYTKQAKIFGYKSRAVFKLIDIDKKFNIINKRNILEIGSYPGGWTEYIVNRAHSTLAVDIKAQEEIAGVSFIRCSIFDDDFFEKIKQYAPFDCVLSDAAPNISNIKERDEEEFCVLINRIILLNQSILSNGGFCVMKFFNYFETQKIVTSYKKSFTAGNIWRPEASKKRSLEHYFIGKGYKT